MIVKTFVKIQIRSLGFGKKDILKFVEINSCSISSQNIVHYMICWDFTIFLTEKKHDSSYKNRWNQNSYLIVTETNQEGSKNSWNTIIIREVYPQSHVKSLIWNLVKHQKHCLCQNFLFVESFSLQMYRWIFFYRYKLQICKYNLQILNQTHLALSSRKNWLKLSWFCFDWSMWFKLGMQNSYFLLLHLDADNPKVSVLKTSK